MAITSTMALHCACTVTFIIARAKLQKITCCRSSRCLLYCLPFSSTFQLQPLLFFPIPEGCFPPCSLKMNLVGRGTTISRSHHSNHQIGSLHQCGQPSMPAWEFLPTSYISRAVLRLSLSLWLSMGLNCCSTGLGLQSFSISIKLIW